MKKLGLSILLAIVWTSGMSQRPSNPEYWVVETRSIDTAYSIVRFYNGNNELLHEVKIDDLVINIQQKKQRKRLNQLLNEYQLRAASGTKKIRSKPSV